MHVQSVCSAGPHTSRSSEATRAAQSRRILFHVPFNTPPDPAEIKEIFKKKKKKKSRAEPSLEITTLHNSGGKSGGAARKR